MPNFRTSGKGFPSQETEGMPNGASGERLPCIEANIQALADLEQIPQSRLTRGENPLLKRTSRILKSQSHP